MDDAEGGPLPCPFCGQEPHRMPHPDPTYPQVQCRNIECPIGINGEEVSLESWNIRAHPPKAQGVPEIVVKALRIAMHHWMKDGVESADEEDATFCDSVLQELLLSTTPPADKPEREWVKCSERLPKLGQRVQLFSQGVIQHMMPLFDDSDEGLFWDFEVHDYNPPVDFSQDQWKPLPAAPDMGGEK